MGAINRENIMKKRGYRSTLEGDDTSIYISSPLPVAKYIADRLGAPDTVIAELCCGIGVTLEHLAAQSRHVIGVDFNKKTLSVCKRNLEHSGLSGKVTLICGDITDINVIKSIKADIVVYDIPHWGLKTNSYSNPHEENPKLTELIKVIRTHITNAIVIFTPPSYSYENAKIDIGNCEYQSVYIDDKHDRNFIYLGGLVNKAGYEKLFLTL